MRTLHFGLRVADLERSLAFYAAVGYEVVGTAPETPLGRLTMLKLPDDPFVTIELVHDGSRPAADSSLSHVVIQVASMASTIDALAIHGIVADAPSSPDGRPDFLTTIVTDPDGNRIELVQWPAGHADGMTAADFAS
jgi:lactoylglutathione lyase